MQEKELGRQRTSQNSVRVLNQGSLQRTKHKAHVQMETINMPTCNVLHNDKSFDLHIGAKLVQMFHTSLSLISHQREELIVSEKVLRFKPVKITKISCKKGMKEKDLKN